jgi:hypothetical protein
MPTIVIVCAAGDIGIPGFRTTDSSGRPQFYRLALPHRILCKVGGRALRHWHLRATASSTSFALGAAVVVSLLTATSAH